MNKRDLALSWAARGFPVFRLQPNSKIPLAGSNGHLEATTDPQTIIDWWSDPLTGGALDFNIGYSPRDGRHLILDLDEKDDRNGIANYLAMGGQIGGIVVRTTSGGLHVYTRGDDLRTGAGRIGTGIDTRGADGYVVAPGSTIDGVPYEVICDGEPLPIPAFIASKIGTRAERDRPRLVYRQVENDLPLNVERAEFVAANHPEARPGQWHELGFKLGAELARVAISPEKAVEIAELYWVPRGEGFKSRDQFVRDILGGYHTAVKDLEHGMNSVATVDAALRQMPIILPDKTVESPSLDIYYSRTWSEGKELRSQPVEYVVKGLVGPGDLMAVLGGPGSGKSVVLPYLAFCVALGLPFMGRKVKQGRVLYFAAENGLGLERRLQVLGDELGDPGDALRVFPLPLNLSIGEDAAAERMVRTILHYAPAMVILDTLFASFPLTDLTSRLEGGIGFVVQAMKNMAQLPPRPILCLGHHTPKNGSEAAYGGQQLQAAFDTTLFVSGELKADRAVQVRKNRMGPDGDTAKFRIASADVCVDEEGDTITAPILRWIAEDADKRAENTRWLAETNSGARNVLEILKRLVSEALEAGDGVSAGEVLCGGPAARVSRDALRKALVVYGSIAEDLLPVSQDKLTSAWLHELKRRDFVDYDSSEVWVLPKG